jgi:hypothetical protein
MAILDAFLGKINIPRLNHDSSQGGIESLTIGQGTAQLAAGTLGTPEWVYPDVGFLHGRPFPSKGSICRGFIVLYFSKEKGKNFRVLYQTQINRAIRCPS